MGIGLGTSILVLMFIISFALYLGTPTHTSSIFLSWLGGKYTHASIMSSLTVSIALTAVSGIIAYAVTKDIMTPLIVSVTTFLISLIAVPLDTLNEAVIPVEFKVLLVGVFGLMYVLAMASFFRGSGGTP
jgi:hypothetical protein